MPPPSCRKCLGRQDQDSPHACCFRSLIGPCPREMVADIKLRVVQYPSRSFRRPRQPSSAGPWPHGRHRGLFLEKRERERQPLPKILGSLACGGGGGTHLARTAFLLFALPGGAAVVEGGKSLGGRDLGHHSCGMICIGIYRATGVIKQTHFKHLKSMWVFCYQTLRVLSASVSTLYADL
jgi:hypothetical protein